MTGLPLHQWAVWNNAEPGVVACQHQVLHKRKPLLNMIMWDMFKLKVGSPGRTLKLIHPFKPKSDQNQHYYFFLQNFHISFCKILIDNTARGFIWMVTQQDFVQRLHSFKQPLDTSHDLTSLFAGWHWLLRVFQEWLCFTSLLATYLSQGPSILSWKIEGGPLLPGYALQGLVQTPYFSYV